jgi:HD-GYP domain-containing protein (c-di-GMP phosphodiesterase class II)
MVATLDAPIRSSAGRSANEFHSVHASCLRLGTTLRVPIYDENDILLLARGQTITPVFMEKLRARQVSAVKVHQSELSRVFAGSPQGNARDTLPSHEGVYCPVESAASVALDTLVKKGGYLGLPPQGQALAETVAKHGKSNYSEADFDTFVANQEQAMQQVEDVYTALVEGRGFDADALSSVADEALDDLTKDSDLFACLGANPHSDRYPVRHSMHVSMLSVALGTKLGLDRQTLKELSMGCLIHDAGMLRIDEDLYASEAPLNRVEFLEITKHPVVVFDMMKKMEKVPSRAAFVAYQIHERVNGEGYPRKRRGEQMHFLSKVAAVADAYIALVSPRPHRPGMLPYKAMERMLKQVQERLFDPLAFRALLNTVSLFPIGSFVELSDGRVGKVIRSNGEAYHRPIVSAWKKGQIHTLPDVVDLKDEVELKIARTLPGLQEFAAKQEDLPDWD